MKHQADKHRLDCSFSASDIVFLKLQPYVQLTIAPHASHMFSFRFFGPFHILEKIGPVTYKLQLPAFSTMHLVFHVSQLKRAVPATI
jgi:hypothetical protein